jgi:hypothetical protein
MLITGYSRYLYMSSGSYNRGNDIVPVDNPSHWPSDSFRQLKFATNPCDDAYLSRCQFHLLERAYL